MSLQIKQIARIGKNVLHRMLSELEELNIEKASMQQDYTLCNKSCPFYNLCGPGAKEIGSYCLNCEKVSVLKSDKEASICIPNKVRLSKSQILQLLYYHFCSIDANGIVKRLSVSAVSNALGISFKTVKNNNKRLADYGFIATSSCEDSYNVIIMGYKDLHLKKSNGGSGYLQMTKDFILHLLSIGNVNVIRLELKKLLKYDNDEFWRTTPEQLSKFKIKELKSSLPYYFKYTGALNDILSYATKLFDTTKEKDAIYFKLKDEFNASIVKGKLEGIYSESITNHKINGLYNVTEVDKVDLLGLAFEYSIESVLAALNLIITKYITNNIVIDKLGALTRFVIKSVAITNIA